MKLRLVTIFACTLLAGCVMPEVRKETETPRVFGAVYDYETRHPIKGAFVAFVDSESGETKYKDHSLNKVSAHTPANGQYSIEPTSWTYYFWLVGPCGEDLPSRKNEFHYLRFSASGYTPVILYVGPPQFTPTKHDSLPDFYNLRAPDVYLKKNKEPKHALDVKS